MMVRLGSLFDGSGGFPLAGMLSGATPVWASETELYPIAVTRSHFHRMRHLGSVTEVHGGEIEPVDVITFGSPCQDLSVAGKRAGIHEGERSSLFFQAIRIIKEMREKTNGRYPTFAVLENVPGAFSSNRGDDFRAALEEFCKVWENGVSIPRPADGRWNHAGEIVGDGFSVAWRQLDAQYWGAPQRRKRIYLVADFAGQRAGKILFERESMRGDSAQDGAQTKSAAAADDAGSAGRSSGVQPEQKVIFCMGNGQREASVGENVCSTLVCYGEPPIIAMANDVRFLTPLECCRLQGFPDGWGVPERKGSLTEEEAAFWEGVRKTHAAINGKKYSPCKSRAALTKWYNGLHTDSAEYKMWGNGIALPCAAYVVRGCVEALKDQA